MNEITINQAEAAPPLQKRPAVPEPLKPPSQSKASGAYDILNKLDRWVTPTGRKYANVNGTATPLRRSEQIKEYVSHDFVHREGETISEAAIEQAVLAVSGQPLEVREVHVRVGGAGGEVVVDLFDQNRTVSVTTAGIRIQANTAAFARPAGTGSLKVPDLSAFGIDDSVSAFEEFFSLLGMEGEANRVATAAFMVQAMRPKGPFAMLIVRGPQGGGKTTLAREIRRAIDPRSPDDVELPHSNRHLAILAEHNHLLCFDNVSVIDQKTSDALCRLATGAGFVTRALRTDRELAAFLSSRPVLMTSIGDVAVAPDLLDRALMLNLPPVHRKKSEAEMSKLLDDLRPRLTAALMFAAHVAMKNLHAVEVPGEIRMMDAAKFAVAAEPALGLEPGSVVKAFLGARREAALITSLDSVVSRTVDLLKQKSTWRGSLEELLDALHGVNGSSRSRAAKDLPGNARALRDRLDRVAGSLRHFGVSVDLSQLHPTQRTRVVILERTDAFGADDIGATVSAKAGG